MIGLGFRLGKRLKKIATESTPPPWTPADIADLAIFFHFKEGNGSCFYGTDPAVADGGMDKILGLYGAEVTQAEGNVTLRPDGLQLAADGSTSMAFSSQFSATDITIYWSQMIANDSAIACFASDSVFLSLLGGTPDVTIVDNIGNIHNSPLLTTNAVVMGRLTFSALGEKSLIATGQAERSSTGETNFGFSFNQIGGIGAIGVGNDSESNRFRLVIAIKRAIALGSAEDLIIRNWIAANDGASI